MDLRDLYYFETIADLGNFGRGSDKLHRTQPALSKSIQRLEQTLGTALFFREGRRMRLTPAGELLLMRARHLRQGVQETRREIQNAFSLRRSGMYDNSKSILGWRTWR